MDIASFENLNTLYQFKAVDKYPQLRHPSLKRISFSTTALLGAINGAVSTNFRSTAISIGSVGHDFNHLTHTLESSNGAETKEELIRQSSDEVDGTTPYIEGFDDYSQSPSYNFEHIYQASNVKHKASLPDTANQNRCNYGRLEHILKQQPPMLNRSQTVQCLGGVANSCGKQVEIVVNKQEGRRDASVDNKNYYEWYDPKDKSGSGFKYSDKRSRAITPLAGAPLSPTSYNTVAVNVTNQTENIQRGGGESHQSSLTKNRKAKLTTSVENLLALK